MTFKIRYQVLIQPIDSDVGFTEVNPYLSNEFITYEEAEYYIFSNLPKIGHMFIRKIYRGKDE
jgi:hypothetical protein